ncbi:hypothetical protein [Bradyrhizobium sp.]|jgi:hypothetical protein|uniref:hypothetical protein n=1 Tax=Bradyrhizobium sp. TaxID=376 RepID=UPI003C24F1FF
MNWAKERDLLISETMAFVQSIGAAKLELEVRDQPRTEATVGSSTPVDKAEADKTSEVKKSQEVERPAELVRMTSLSLVPPGALRQEVESRVAAFRAHQQLFHRERDAYFHAVLDKARGSAGDRPLSASFRDAPSSRR